MKATEEMLKAGTLLGGIHKEIPLPHIRASQVDGMKRDVRTRVIMTCHREPHDVLQGDAFRVDRYDADFDEYRLCPEAVWKGPGKFYSAKDTVYADPNCFRLA
jgi:hypothetical protein